MHCQSLGLNELQSKSVSVISTNKSAQTRKLATTLNEQTDNTKLGKCDFIIGNINEHFTYESLKWRLSYLSRKNCYSLQVQS